MPLEDTVNCGSSFIRLCGIFDCTRIDKMNLRFGKLPPRVDYRTLNFKNYVTEDIPEPPTSLDVTDRVLGNLYTPNVSEVFPLYDNDRLGDCTVAGAAHGVALYHGMINQKHVPLLSNVVKIYFHLTGGADSGLYMLDILKYWRNSGIEDHKVSSYVSVNRYNHTHIKQAIMLFGGLMIGFQCQEKVIDEFNENKPWKPGRFINAGHCVFVTGYSPEGIKCLTWGDTQWGTWAWWDEHVDESYALLPPEAMEEGFTKGWDYKKLKEDLAEVAL